MEIKIEKLKSGYTEYTLRESRTILTSEGKRQEYLRSGNCLVDAALRPISVETTVRQGGVAVTTKGSVVDGTMYLTTDFGKGRVERWREDVRDAVVDISLPDVAVRSLPEAPKRLYRLSDHRSVQADLRIEADSAKNAIIVAHAGAEFWHISPTGRLSRYDVPGLGISWIPAHETSKRPETCVMNAGLEWDAGAAVLPTAADNIKSLRARILLKAQVGATLSPEDARQRLDAGIDAEGRSIGISLSHGGKPLESLPLPVLHKDFFPFVRGDSALTLDGDAVRRRANALKAWERNSDVVLRALAGTIRREFTRDPFIPATTANGVAQVPRGSSFHASLLFVAVARAVGLPARFAFGVAPSHGRWTTKVWVEVWSGDWVPMDAESGEAITDAVHIKLLDAVSMADVLDQSGRLRGNLGIRVDSVQLVDTSANATLQTAIIGSVYTNKKFRCSITAPSPEWLMEERSAGDETMLVLSPTMGSPVEFTVLLFRSTWQQSADELLGARIKALQVLLDGLTMQQRGEVRVAGRRAPTIMYTFVKRNGGSNVRTASAHCLLVDEGRSYMFSFSAPEETFESIRPEMERVLREFRLH
ncbi:MAG: transglutaminase-like domain-containing protein [Bacteroidia bacterium]|nr:transglutaminase-like domain-containing protein [Bacteroidia bacterium]